MINESILGAAAAAFLFVLVAAPAPASAVVGSEACARVELDRIRIDVAAANIANMETTRTAEGGPYFRHGVECVSGSCRITRSSRSREVFDPGHPDADARGVVRYPRISFQQEIAAMLEAQRDLDSVRKDCF